ncbi:pilus subunit protein PilA [Tepidicaulis marinus]|uniref:Pilus subunit protein PilA n=1 Tax=Tepidicaulis marinus TaxID=1333998 RepID=A0A081BBI2_9HYPH|nr:Flp family type IVb pilin [Tepidicaulis marinus]GAK45400.1 pilus subunit protein PilA [Tepidicaulis marinus]
MIDRAVCVSGDIHQILDGQSFTRRFFCDESGATALEYSLIVAGIGLAMFGATSLVGDAVVQIFQDIAAKLGSFEF